jgi:hypothetical protein
MRVLSFMLSAFTLAAAVSCTFCSTKSYDKTCFTRYLSKVNQLNEKFKDSDKAKQMDFSCQFAINITLEALQKTSNNDQCVSNLLSSKKVPDVLLRKYLAPQMDNGKKNFTFNKEFDDFRRKSSTVASIVCNNKEIFRPNIRQMMRTAKLHKESKSKELKCLEIYIKKPQNQILTQECIETVDEVRREFYQRINDDSKRAFIEPYDQLIDFDCGREHIVQNQLFEKVFFFVVLAITRDLNDKQIENVGKNTDGAVDKSQKIIFECMK